MRRMIFVTTLALCTTSSSWALPTGHTEPPLRADVRALEDSTFALTVEFLHGYHPNPRVPAQRRLRLESGARTWTTEDFSVTRHRATLRVHHTSSAGALTAYLCREDRCTRAHIPVRFED